jgi:hypothetical protein
MSYHDKSLNRLMLALPLTLALTCPAQATEGKGLSPNAEVEQALSDNLQEKWGIQVLSVFLSGSGNLVDFRYRVIDPVKAAQLTKPEVKPILIDQTTGFRLVVPSSPKLGPMRQTTRQPITGKIYFMMFANTRHQVKSGDKVTVVVGDFRAENLIVE